MSILVQWAVGSRQAKSVIAVRSEEERWAALMNYLTKSNILFVPEASFEYPTQQGLFCFAQKDGTYCIYQAVETPEWDKNLGPPPIYAVEIAYLDWVWVPVDQCAKAEVKPDDKPKEDKSGCSSPYFHLQDFVPRENTMEVF